MKLPKELTTVTPFSKTLAIIIFFLFPLIGFYAGMKYQTMFDDPQINLIERTITQIPPINSSNISCQVDNDCILAVRDSWSNCPSPTDVCNRPNYLDSKWVSVNKNWYYQQIADCNTFDCPSFSPFNHGVTAKCIQNACQKVTQSPQLFIYKEIVDGSKYSPTAVSAYRVDVNTNLLKDRSVQEVIFNLPDDVSYTVTKQRIFGCGAVECADPATCPAGCATREYTWIGNIEEARTNAPVQVTIVVNGDTIAGTIPAVLGVNKYMYRIGNMAGETSTILFKIDPSKFPPD